MSVRDIMNTLGGCSVHWADTMSTLGFTMMSVGDIMSTLGVFDTPEDIMSTPGGYHEYTGGIPRCMWGVIMSTLRGVQYTGGIP